MRTQIFTFFSFLFLATTAVAAPVERFYWYYQNNPDQRRDWTRSDNGIWAEFYPDGQSHRFTEIAREQVEGNYGVLLCRKPDNGQQFFIPDQGSQHMILFFRQNATAPWIPLANMLGVATY